MNSLLSPILIQIHLISNTIVNEDLYNPIKRLVSNQVENINTLLSIQTVKAHILTLQTDMQDQSLPHIWFLLLINTKSGGGWGRRYLSLKKRQFCFQYKKLQMIHVQLIDLFDHKTKEQQLQRAKQLQTNKINSIRIIMCGGDGTMIWGIEECYKAGLDFSQLQFGCLPIGTGNDFSRTIGWGSNPIQFKEGDILSLKKRIIEWIGSGVEKYDVWEMELSLYEKGQIYHAKNGEDVLTDKRFHKTGFVNYVGLGIDGRVSYNFQKNRKSTKFLNYAVYVGLGCILCCKSFPQINQFIQTFESTQRSSSNHVSESPRILKQPDLDQSITDKLNSQQQQQRSSRKITIKDGYHGLVCMNSISYMGGAENAWRTKKLGCKEKQVHFDRQSFNDGKIQFLGYTNEIILAMEHIIHTGYKLAQGQGPFYISFKEESIQYDNYIQVDGESMKVKGIKELMIRRHSKIPTINVMVKKGKK